MIKSYEGDLTIYKNICKKHCMDPYPYPLFKKHDLP